MPTSEPRKPESACVLLAACSERERDWIEGVLSPSGWELRFAADTGEALHQLGGQDIQVLLCDGDAAEPDWRRILEATLDSPQRAPLIVFSRLADDRLWAEVLSSGGYDVLAKPFDAEEVLRVVGMARRSWASGPAAAHPQANLASAARPT